MPVLKEDTLLAMQKAARERYKAILGSVSFYDLEPVKEKKTRNTRKHIPESKKKYFKEDPVKPDEKKVIVRPPTKYSNSSPYGIASGLLLGK